MADNAFVKIMTALLKHQIKKLVGDEALGVIGEELAAIGGDELDEQVKLLLGEKTTAEALDKAAKYAQDAFLGKIGDQDLEQWMVSLPLADLPTISKAIAELPDTPDEGKLEIAIRESIENTWRHLSPLQVDLAVKTYMRCLHEALLPLEKQTLMIVGRSVLRTEEKIDSLLKLVEQILDKSSSQATIYSKTNEEKQFLKPDLRFEKLYSNLLEIESFAKSIFVARTRARGRNEIYRKLHELGTNPDSEFILRNKSLISFHNLNRYPWSEVCESASTLEYSSSEWAFSSDINKKNEFIDLLNKSLETKLSPEVLFDRDEKYYFFAPTENLRDKELSYPSLQKNTSRFVFRGYYKKTEQKIGYYRHSAFFGKFLRFGDTWYLEISPHYRFTTNGYRLSRFSDTQLSAIKRIELNPAILGQIVMWAEYLSRRPDLFTKEYPFLIFGNLKSFDLEYGFDDDVWLNREDEDNQMLDVVKSSINDLPLFKGSE